MVALITVLAVVLLSLVITRVATIALALTGLSKESARFQARSALSGVGFTTSEAEGVVNHPIRRGIVLRLMLIGSAGIVTAIASLIVSFGGATSREGLLRGGVLVGGLFALWLLSRSEWFDRTLSRLIVRFLRSRGLDVRDYVTLLHLEGDYAINELTVASDHWVAGRTLADLRLRDEGILVLGIHRPGHGHIGVPARGTRLEPGDRLTVYGRSGRVDELEARAAGPAGDAAHREAVSTREREAAADQAAAPSTG